MTDVARPDAARPAPAQPVRLGEIAAQLGGELIGPVELLVSRIGPLEGATPSTLSFLSHPKYQSQLATTAAGCVIVAPAMREAAVARGAAIVTADPYLYFAHLTQWWARRVRPAAEPGIHPSACVAPGAQIGEGVRIEAFVVVEEGAVIGDGAVIGSHSVVGQGARIGAGTRLAPRVSLLHGCSIGARGILHSGVVIGADGFGFAPHQGEWVKIEQLGVVRIGDDVEIGANSCIDRGALDDTVIEDGVKLDNLVQIAHNVHIGAHTAMAGCVGVAGSARIGAHCTVGGGAGILGHLTLADHVHISSMSLVTRSILQPGLYSGVFPIDDNKSWEKNAATLRQLHGLRERLRTLEKKFAP
ncbi:UDP-3-O-(3-hydroxymyristoyl)glucosamine N-acyltransferase [Aquabacterium sp. A7-Y]|uniref:UDP-3-O-(3-hydroxymyristoyl)glucosamine N-acyltransferase n=1 Tax=Aquabacterium sp. A7-Y TaxID=1349605 RepID=UPI00223CEE69|nr:UDP-3-O-(3-hydroxymyristoyl)glucosamine N-acyltransferase [Aquabacterium sp. A7-Y]MCW7540313.1 UDP-3-O-(3-hydroxymyristoyl)glucosamine N-acyltransferase [Aquabacterium sp. A7-Y]